MPDFTFNLKRFFSLQKTILSRQCLEANAPSITNKTIATKTNSRSLELKHISHIHIPITRSMFRFNKTFFIMQETQVFKMCQVFYPFIGLIIDQINPYVKFIFNRNFKGKEWGEKTLSRKKQGREVKEIQWLIFLPFPEHYPLGLLDVYRSFYFSHSVRTQHVCFKMLRILQNM